MTKLINFCISSDKEYQIWSIFWISKDPSFFCSYQYELFYFTRSYAALRAADLDYNNQKRHQRGVTTDLGGGAGQEYTKTSLTRGHNWPFRCLDLCSWPEDKKFSISLHGIENRFSKCLGIILSPEQNETIRTVHCLLSDQPSLLFHIHRAAVQTLESLTSTSHHRHISTKITESEDILFNNRFRSMMMELSLLNTDQKSSTFITGQ